MGFFFIGAVDSESGSRKVKVGPKRKHEKIPVHVFKGRLLFLEGLKSVMEGTEDIYT
jgi:hypothetical protein